MKDGVLELDIAQAMTHHLRDVQVNPPLNRRSSSNTSLKHW